MTIPILVIAGPSGCGKTSIAQALSEMERFAYIEGDELHPAENIQKMSQGHPLQDEDRWPWLDKVRETAVSMARAPDALGVIVTCSSLKQKYRKVLTKVNEQKEMDLALWFIFLNVSKEELVRRMESRKGHYMKLDMLESQLQDLQMPDADESYCRVVDANRSLSDTEEAVKLAAAKIIKELDHS